MKKFPGSIFEEFVDHDFNDQIVESLKLCAMHQGKAEDGGYPCNGQIDFGEISVNQ